MSIAWNFRQQSAAEIDAMVERHFDRMLDDYLAADDAWDYYDPDWSEVYDIVDGYDPEEIADLVRDHLDGNGDLQVELYEAGLLAAYVNPALQMKDPDEVWDEVDRIFAAHWDDDDFMVALWDSELVYKPICEALKKNADDDGYNDIRERFNRRHEDDGREDW